MLLSCLALVSLSAISASVAYYYRYHYSHLQLYQDLSDLVCEIKPSNTKDQSTQTNFDLSLESTCEFFDFEDIKL